MARLMEFISLLDKYEIDHVEESLLRTLIRNRKGCKSRGTQYFLKAGFERSIIERDHTTTAMSCACIPYRDIPDEFIENLSQSE